MGPRPSRTVDIAMMRRAVAVGAWTGQNRLSSSHIAWPVIDEVARATCFEEGDFDCSARRWRDCADFVAGCAYAGPGRSDYQAAPDAALDDVTSISAEHFYAILDRLLPRLGFRPGMSCRGHHESTVPSLCIASTGYPRACIFSSAGAGGSRRFAESHEPVISL